MSTVGKVIAGIVLMPIAILAIGIGGCEVRKAYYDRQVRAMCEDGGLKIIEQVVVTRDILQGLPRTNGRLHVPSKATAKPTDPVYWVTNDTYLRQSSPEVRRSEHQAIRSSDGKVVATYVSYARVGGDFPSPVHPSSFACPESKTFAETAEQIYLVKESK